MRGSESQILGPGAVLVIVGTFAGACSSSGEHPPVLDSPASSCPSCGGAGGRSSLDFIRCTDPSRPSAAEFDSAVAALAARDDQTPPPEHPIVFTGSSSIERWTTLSFDMAPHHVVQNGLSGSRISDSLAHYPLTILPYAPSALVFYAGENDLFEGLSPACVFRDFEDLVESLRDEGMNAPIFFVSMKPSPARAAIQSEMDLGNSYIQEYAAQTDSVDYIDIVDKMLNSSGDASAGLFVEDQLHMNEAGYAIWAAEIKPYLDDL